MIIVYKKGSTNSFLVTLRLGCPDQGFAYGIFVSQQLLFLFSKHLNTMANVTDCGYSKTNFWEVFNIIETFNGSMDHGINQWLKHTKKHYV